MYGPRFQAVLNKMQNMATENKHLEEHLFLTGNKAYRLVVQFI